ncbi:MAG: hypothetical protein H7098_04570 [Oligoflexus sp.]|nr:hypothetical protein [Pseudopedobacter sp.]
MINDKTDSGKITIIGAFEANKAVKFGIAVMTFAKYEIIDDNNATITNPKNLN